MKDGADETIRMLSTIFFQRFDERVVECFVSRQQPHLHQRCSQMRVASRCRHAFTHGAETMADGESTIPQQAENLFQHGLHFITVLAAVEKQQIDV